MNKSEFINTLRELLSPLSRVERNKFIAYYEEIIEDYKESGLTEEEIASKLGSPQIIADNILNEQDSSNIKIPSSNNKKLNIILLILGFPLWASILLTILLLILSAYIVIWCIPFTTGAISVSFLALSIKSIIGSPFMMFDILSVGIIQLGFGIASAGISILSAIVTIYLTKKILVITKNLTFKILNSFKQKVVKVW